MFPGKDLPLVNVFFPSWTRHGVNRSCAGDFFTGLQDVGPSARRVKGWMYVKWPAKFMFFTDDQGAVPGWTAAANYPPPGL
jgi:hypothetical protein